MKKIAIGIVVGMSWFAGQAMAAGDVAAGKTKAAVCAACHGADGNAAVPMYPSLAGQGEAYLVKQIHDFKKGKDVLMSNSSLEQRPLPNKSFIRIFCM